MKQIEVAGLKLTVEKKEHHIGMQPSKWDDVRHHLVDDKGNPDKTLKVEGFEKLSEASACASRMRKVWNLPIKSYTNVKTGLFGICYKAEDEPDEPEAVEAQPELPGQQ
jgi:hypothetical protein